MKFLRNYLIIVLALALALVIVRVAGHALHMPEFWVSWGIGMAQAFVATVLWTVLS